MINIHKIYLFLVITLLSGCYSEQVAIDAYGYHLADNKCKKINSCPIVPVSKLTISANRNTQQVVFKDESLNEKSENVYGKLSECLVIDYQNFKCKEMTVSNANFKYAVFKYNNDSSEIEINKENYFSKYFAISSSKSLYITSSIYPLITLGSQSHEYAHYKNLVMLAVYLITPLMLISFTYYMYLELIVLLKNFINRIKKKIKI